MEEPSLFQAEKLALLRGCQNYVVLSTCTSFSSFGLKPVALTIPQRKGNAPWKGSPPGSGVRLSGILVVTMVLKVRASLSTED